MHVWMALQRKRKHDQFALANIALDSGVSVAAAIRVLMASHPNVPLNKNMLTKYSAAALKDVASISNVFGTMCKTRTIAGVKGDLKVYYCDPKVLLYHAISTSSSFSMLLLDIGKQELTIVLYLDEAVPGNQNRPDPARAAQCLYWTILELPHWFIVRDSGWFPLSYVLVKDQKAARVSDSKLVADMLDVFDDPSVEGCNFAVDVQSKVIRFNVRINIADWKQHKATFNLKGHGGNVCCYFCCNCVGHCEPFSDDPFLVHVSSHEYDKFVHHTYDTIINQVSKVEVASHGPANAFSMIQRATGFTYEHGGLMWNRKARETLQLPYAAYVDWQHDMVASGGWAQYEVNQMALVFI